ncbi:TPA: hypothetical protein MYP81_000115 [Citrobacter farmeri]|uniref:hypothetical protein n=1 Tax=Citrobacter farmeri TaxID=67824 RepID=UPI001A2E83EE|nr:hypothetical protein [Citrobacter farmeri]MBU5644084.1 hypothetical protein [Pluralibacter sp. S54_ASV_43]HAT3756931.1 hypothetical protein [Citrobacter amalonaticus]HAU5706297.1 hypothetical protein [Citrobacter freundii]QZE47621.1 hypothetical protein Cf24236_2875 [Citrobacter farmeri]HCB1594030.1 hypothetical protein [Citrobacter farmeri]
MSQYAWVFGLIGNLLVFIGWVVVYINAKNISTRAEIKSVVDSLVKNYTELSDIGMKYWFDCGKGYDNPEHYIAVVMAKITISFKMLEFLEDRGLSINNDFAAISYFLTYECETVETVENIERYSKANKINNEIMSSITNILDAFHQKYPPSHYVDLHKWKQELDGY